MDRFKKVYRQGTIEVIEIWIDTEMSTICFTGMGMRQV